VLLLNSVLSVQQAAAASHQGKGWEQFTDRAIEVVNRDCEHVVFLLWGAYAQRKGAIIDPQRHCILKAPHPSPLSAHRGFFGCGHFRAANEYLLAQGRQPIDWQLAASP
jgi:uracil-DNA glycosylase